ETIQADVPPELLARMRRIADSKKGKGLARVEASTCTECRVTVRPQVWMDLVMREDLHQCPGCGRILFREENLHDGEFAPPPPREIEEQEDEEQVEPPADT